MTLVVEVSDCKVSADPEALLVTYSLGSCIAVALHDPVARAGGLLHFMLPESSLDPAKAARNPFVFGDTGIAEMAARLRALGAERGRLIARLAGGARVFRGHEMFHIGRENTLAARAALTRERLAIAAEAVGGAVSRTVRMEIATGRVAVREEALGAP